MFAVASGGLSAEALAVWVGSAAAVAGIGGEIFRRRQKRTRSSWRYEDKAHGYEDDRGVWHVGAVDLVAGWDDDRGIHHEGLDIRVANLERATHRHAEGGVS